MGFLLLACNSTTEGNESGSFSASGVSGADDSDDSESTGGDSSGTTSTGSTTTGDTTTSTSTGSESGNDDGSFVPEDFGGDSCGVQCDIWTPGDCPEGEKCTSVDCEGADSAWDSTVCRPLAGDGTFGDECTAVAGSGVDGYDDCGEGLMCWDINADTGQGYCIPFCSGSAASPSCDTGLDCQVWHDGALPICLPKCDPISSGSDCPNDENVCVPSAGGDGFVCVLDVSGGTSPVGTDCTFNNTCNQGLACVDAAVVPDCNGGSWGCCTEVCDLTSNPVCSAPGAECVAWFEDPVPPGYEHVGFCGLPG